MLKPERSIPTLFSDAMAQFAKLISNEFDLAKAELTDKASRLGKSVTLLLSGAVLMIPAIVVLLIAVANWLMTVGFTASLAYAITGGVTALAAAALVGTGLSGLSSENLKPTETINQLQRDKRAAEEMVK